jgi:glucose-1-phosphate thymidylyltransferase
MPSGTTRALVLARGLGTRMRSADPSAVLTDAQRRAADAGMKALMPIGGRPFLDYVLGALADAGVRQVAMIVAPDHRAVREHYEERPPARLQMTLLVQQEALGTANAVLAAESWTKAEPFLVMNGDNLYPARALADLGALEEPGFAAFDDLELIRTSNIPEERIRAFALVEVDDSGYLSRIVEKPSQPSTGLSPTTTRRFVSMNLWRFDARIFPACRDVPASARGEYELPEAVAFAAQRGMKFRAVPSRGPVLDLSRRADAQDVERRLAGVVPQL